MPMPHVATPVTRFTVSVVDGETWTIGYLANTEAPWSAINTTGAILQAADLVNLMARLTHELTTRRI